MTTRTRPTPAVPVTIQGMDWLPTGQYQCQACGATYRTASKALRHTCRRFTIR